MTSEHLTPEQVERYIAGTMTPQEVIALHDHIAACETCRHACSARRWGVSGESALGNVPSLQRIQIAFTGSDSDEPEHLSYEQLIGHVEGTLNDVDREIAESHLEACTLCARERADLAAYALERQDEDRQTRPVLQFWRIGAIFAAAAVLILLAVIVPGLRHHAGRVTISRVAVKPSPAGPMRPVPTHSAVAVPGLAAVEAREAKALAEKDAIIRRLQRQNAQLRRPAVPAPSQIATARVGDEAAAQLKELNAGKSFLMGGAESGSAMRLKSPVGVIVLSTRPSFQWTPAHDENGTPAGYYVVQIWDPRQGQAHPIVTSPHITGTSWTPTTLLPRATVLRWQARAYLDGGEFLAAAPTLNAVARFRIIELAKAHQFAQSHTNLASVYLNSGLILDARQELAIALDIDPGNQAARSVLKKTKALMP